jgi:hypothetical protein
MSRSAIMPPLLEEEIPNVKTSEQRHKSRYRGLSNEYVIKSYYLSMGVDTATPEPDEGSDLWILKENRLYKIQIKSVVFERDPRKRSRTRFRFKFQRQSASVKYTKQRTPKDIDIFHHVLSTPYRTLIWETLASDVPLREDGSFKVSTSMILDRDVGHKTNNCGLGPERSKLIFSQYSPEIYKEFPEFFMECKIK